MEGGEATIRERIRSAATRLFAVAGFDGVSMRAIAQEARTSLRLVQHHFGDKEQLYRAIWEGSQGTRSADRKRAIEALNYDRPTSIVLRDLVEIVIRPVWMAAREQTPTSFLRVIAYEAIDPRRDDRRLIEDYLDRSDAETFLAAFARALPKVPREELVTCHLWVASAFFFFLVAAEPRSRRLGGLRGEAEYDRFVDFAVAAWLELAPEGS